METRLAEPHPADESHAKLIVGILLIATGVAAISASVLSALISVLVLGILLVVGGAMAAVYSAERRRVGRGLAQFLSGVFAVIVGVFFLLRPRTSLRTVGPLLLVLFLADGLFMIVSTLRRRDRLWIPEVVVGTITLSLGLVLAYEWASTPGWPVETSLLGTLTGIHLVNRGVLFIAASAEARAAWLRLHLPRRSEA